MVCCVLCAACCQAVTRRLSHLAGEVLAAKQRSKALTAESPGMATPGNTGGIGSVEHTLKVMRSVCVCIVQGTPNVPKPTPLSCIAVATGVHHQNRMCARYIPSKLCACFAIWFSQH